MVITGLSAVENAESFNGLICNIQFREIMVAGVSERVICKRVLDETKQMQGGNIQTRQTGDIRSGLSTATKEKIGNVLGNVTSFLKKRK